MRVSTRACGPTLVLLLCVLGGCADKSPQEIEAERQKEHAEWDARTTAAERSRQAEENRLVQQEILAHEEQQKADDERAARVEAGAQSGEHERLQALVVAQFADPQSVRIVSERWDAVRSTLCGEVSTRGDSGLWSMPAAFVASGGQALIDSTSEDGHARFVEATQSIDCPQ